MKKLIPLIAMLALLSAFSGAAFAQSFCAQEEEDEQGARNLYLAHARNSKRGRPGVRLTIELRRDGASQKVPLNYQFRAGDKVKFHFETNFNAYVKILNVGSSGAVQLLYPYRGAAELVTKTKDYAVPQGDLWFEFDEKAGTEQLAFVFSAQPLAAQAQTTDKALADLHSQSLENGKDFNLVED